MMPGYHSIRGEGGVREAPLYVLFGNSFPVALAAAALAVAP